MSEQLQYSKAVAIFCGFTIRRTNDKPATGTPA